MVTLTLCTQCTEVTFRGGALLDPGQSVSAFYLTMEEPITPMHFVLEETASGVEMLVYKGPTLDLKERILHLSRVAALEKAMRLQTTQQVLCCLQP